MTPSRSSSQVLLLQAASPIPEFKRQRWLHNLQHHEASIAAIEVSEVFVVQTGIPLSPDTRARLLALLEASDLKPCTREAFWILPRRGTRTPWSSKATDIAQQCGLSEVNRIEKVVQVELSRQRALLGLKAATAFNREQLQSLGALLADRMTEEIFADAPEMLEPVLSHLFEPVPGLPMRTVAVHSEGKAALARANHEWGLALSDDELDYLLQAYRALERDPTDVELMMFAQANSEHCRHKIFNASWSLDGAPVQGSLFDRIKATHKASPQGTVVAYHDNAAILQGGEARRWFAHQQGSNGHYKKVTGLQHRLLKVETHNHPTGISPFPGASTGSGGELRDEAATGRGAKPKFGLTGFMVSHLRIPGAEQPWEPLLADLKPHRSASALQIMLEGPIGAAAFNNEFGRPTLVGQFRTFEWKTGDAHFGYHKPIMLAGGVGTIDAALTEKKQFPAGTALVVLGGPGMRIGVGGGAASSLGAGANDEGLDFGSVQRGNPEMQRRAQEVINACWSLGADNPILAIHDVGAGGLSNALPELVNDAGRCASFDLRAIPLDQSGLSPAEIWCNESQERFVLAVAPQALATVQYFAQRERCPIAVVGTATDDGWLRVQDAQNDAPAPVSMPMQVLLGKPPKMHREAASRPPGSLATHDLDCSGLDLTDVVTKVLSHPSVGSKSFLITIGDRTVGGLCHRDPMVGPWQVPVADCGVGLVDFDGVAGEALAIGERTPLALLNPAAASRMAIGEAITNLASAGDLSLGQVKLSANWMAPTGSAHEDGDLLAAVQAASDLCLAVGLSIPVGKDSLSMRARWGQQEVKSPVSLLVTALGPLHDVRQGVTPVLRLHADSSLLLIDLGQGQKRMGASMLAQVQDLQGGVAPDLDDPSSLPKLIEGLKALRKAGLLWAYHDRSDGGLLACLAEMAFASHCGLSINLDMLTIDPFAADWGDFKIRPDQVSVQRNELTIKALFNEELGVVIQVPAERRNEALGLLREAGLSKLTHVIGKPNERDVIEFYRDAKQIASFSRAELHSVWSTTSAAMASLRDEPGCVQAEFEQLATDEGKLSVALSFNASEDIAAPMIARGVKPRVAILREQGVNGHVEMAAAFDRAGFDAFDVHMSDLLAGRHQLKDFQVLAACGGFSYGDVLGAGAGWARSILFNANLAQAFSEFFQRPDTLSLGVCNGCQMLSQLKALIPGAQAWPRFVRNRSEQYEGRLVMVEVTRSHSPWVSGMAGSKLPIVVAHGEGQAHFASPEQAQHARGFLRFVDGAGQATEAYPMNPNGSPQGWTGFTSDDGRAAILMPHPERVFRTLQMSWAPWQQSGEFEEATGWLRLFRNARVALG